MSLSSNSNSLVKSINQTMNIQIILSKSYSLFFFAFVIGLIIDLVLKIRFATPGLDIIGFVFIFLASLWIYWAQTVNQKPKYLPDGRRNFAYGPYAFSRHPTYLGIFVVMVGAALSTDSVSILITSVTAFVISVFTFMEKEEIRHVKKYGQTYTDYMKKVRKII